MIEDYRIRRIPLSRPEEQQMLCDFLARHQLHYEADIQAAFGLFDTEERLLGCGCAAENLLKCFAVETELRGQNALGLLVSALTQDRFANGFYDLLVISRACNEPLFSACGLFPVARTGELVMLENTPNGPERFSRSFLQPSDRGKTVGAIVMNCNPFTLGHQALAEYAASRCDVLHLFVVQEDRSFFSTEVRFRLAKEGVAHLPNVRVHLSGHYIISSATFPTYFLKENESAALFHSELDITLFARRIAPPLFITKRFAGQEPLDPTTACYNDAMRRLLPRHGIEFCEIPRFTQNGQVISASKVRTLLRTEDGCRQALALVPESTRRYLKESWRRNSV